MPKSKGAVRLDLKPRELTPEQQRQVQELRQIDQRVRAHEQAHISAGHGVITSGASFAYTYGPDGRQYAVSGEVGIDTSAEDKPEANIDKGQRIQAAALAPRDPSPQDRSVAAIGARLEDRGYADLALQRQQEQTQSASPEGVVAEGSPTQAEAVTTSSPAPALQNDLRSSRLALAYGADEPSDTGTVNLFA
ncbi:putative metalloprotease CJM1_0395 family protein [Denitratisoma oestradiolicum]|uniref:putative metalloprotease CJM1_0395 family protein n=1 Tax=Denitratisoma oestradiolicum TaxID=311182 RepID=UPI00147736F0|nr:putative metalloprotease CJM1_0395 family protein [Denitratisoma oestradiolicum]